MGRGVKTKNNTISWRVPDDYYTIITTWSETGEISKTEILERMFQFYLDCQNPGKECPLCGAYNVD